MNEQGPSKSARKRASLALQDLGCALTRLAPEQLEAVPLDERLLAAVTEAQRIRSRGALRRQRQLIGKLMRDADESAIRASLERLGDADGRHRGRFRAAEAWRDRICHEGAAALADFAVQTGGAPAVLADLVRDLETAGSDERRRSIRRAIFRGVHAHLAHADGDGDR